MFPFCSFAIDFDGALYVLVKIDVKAVKIKDANRETAPGGITSINFGKGCAAKVPEPYPIPRKMIPFVRPKAEK